MSLNIFIGGLIVGLNDKLDLLKSSVQDLETGNPGCQKDYKIENDLKDDKSLDLIPCEEEDEVSIGIVEDPPHEAAEDATFSDELTLEGEVSDKVFADLDIPPLQDIENLLDEFDDNSLARTYGRDQSRKKDNNSLVSADDWTEVDIDEEMDTAQGDNDVDFTDGLSYEERARQVAFHLGHEHGWTNGEIKVLERVFLRYWWSKTKGVMIRELAAGMTPEELGLAMDIRELWEEHSEFGAQCFQYQWNENAYNPLYYTLSWPVALGIVRAFGSYPDISEFELFLEEIYSHWRSNYSIMNRFPAFLYYLKYRIGMDIGSLNIDPFLTFDNSRFDYYKIYDGSSDVAPSVFQRKTAF